jgi:hypothetical protein
MKLKDYIDKYYDGVRFRFAQDAQILNVTEGRPATHLVQRMIDSDSDINTLTGEITTTTLKHKCKEWVIV